ncbi:MAG: hypothetical protein PHX51_05440 [Clostridia bacterium]|nr:hypothetical protein [Clostridia bacterium]
MSFFKNTKLVLVSDSVEYAVEKMEGVLFEDEEVVAYFEKGNTKMAFTNKRIIITKGRNPQFTYLSYRNMVAYNFKETTKKAVLRMYFTSTPEDTEFKVVVKKLAGDDKTLADLVSVLSNFVW